MQQEEKYLKQSFDDIVFEKRNKLYGSYFLRTIIPAHTKLSLIFSSTVVFILTAAMFIDLSFLKHAPEPVYINTEVTLTDPPPLYEAMPPAVPPAMKKIESDELAEMDVKKDEEVKDDMKTISEEKSDSSSTGTSETGISSNSEKSGDGHTVYNKAEKMPEYPGGKIGLTRYLKDNVEYPKVAQENNITGTVTVYFVVDVDGSVTDVKIIKGIGGGCDEEAVKTIMEMRKWKPGMNGGHPVPVGIALPITFNLSNGG